ncbi:MAG: BRO family protein [Bacteroidota bacterium]
MQLINFNQKDIRCQEYKGETWYSLIDVIAAITDSSNPSAYWRKLKQRLEKENSQVVTNCHKLKFQAQDGKMRATECANRETILRLIQSIPSPSVEPFKLFLANAGHTVMQETENPELLMDRLRASLKQKGYDESWISARLRSIVVREELTDQWKERGIKDKEYANLTNQIMKGTFNLSVPEYKVLKGLVKQNLRDHMSTLELVYTILAEETTKQLAIKQDAQGYEENKAVAERASKIAGESRERFEQKTGLKVITTNNFLQEGK